MLINAQFQIFVGAVYDRALFLESTKYARSQTAPTDENCELSIEH